MHDILLTNCSGIGIDTVSTSRFKEFGNGQESPFLKKVFVQSELDYCFSYKNPDVHFSGIFALKEATSKVLGVTSTLLRKLKLGMTRVVRQKRGMMVENYLQKSQLVIQMSLQLHAV